MESQPQNPEFRNNPENFHPCGSKFNGISHLIIYVPKMVMSTLFSSLLVSNIHLLSN